jgi:hypothetical protein
MWTCRLRSSYGQTLQEKNMGVLTTEQDAKTSDQIAAEAPAGGGGFPPIAFFGDMGGSPQVGVAGNTYAHTCGSVCATLTMPASPNEGDEIGMMRTCGACSCYFVCFNGKDYMRPACGAILTPVSNVSFALNYSLLWKFVAAQDAWIAVQGGEYSP